MSSRERYSVRVGDRSRTVQEVQGWHSKRAAGQDWCFGRALYGARTGTVEAAG